MLTFHLLNGVDFVIVELVDAEERLLLRHKILVAIVRRVKKSSLLLLRDCWLLTCDCKNRSYGAEYLLAEHGLEKRLNERATVKNPKEEKSAKKSS